MMRRAIVPLAAIGIGGLALSGCSQLDSLKQVSGVSVNTLQIAVGYELIDQDIAILVTPNCIEGDSGKTFICEGKTTNNQPISVTANGGTASTFTLAPGGTPTAAPDGTLDMNMTIKVGTRTIYSGSVQDVIDRNQGQAGQ